MSEQNNVLAFRSKDATEPPSARPFDPVAVGVFLGMMLLGDVISPRPAPPRLPDTPPRYEPERA